MKFVGVTSCPAGIAHTYMAAEGLELSAKAAGHEIDVETQGSAGFQPLSAETIAAADAVIFAVDVPVRDRVRFADKPLVHACVKKAISDAPGLIGQAVAAAGHAAASPHWQVASQAAAPAVPGGRRYTDKVDPGAPLCSRIRCWLMTGVSYMIPFVAAGGIMIALSFMLAQLAGGKEGLIQVVKFSMTSLPDHINIIQRFSPTSGMDWAGLLFVVGSASFSFLLPVLSGYIAFAIADRPGLAPGIVGGFIASTMNTGFLGGIATGFIGGFAALWISRWRVPKGVRGIMPVVVTPLLSTFLTAAALILIVGRPLSAVSKGLSLWLIGLSGSNLIILGVVLGLMMG
ncbi:MAG: fructose system or component, partial [Actinomycetota bacterium]|nr:fructose system or component [Actinomycetota bacterium]